MWGISTFDQDGVTDTGLTVLFEITKATIK